MRRSLISFFAVSFFLILSPLPAPALEVPPPPDAYVSDRAHLLSPAAEARLELLLARFEDETSVQVVIATFPGLEGEDLEDFSIRLAERWKPGEKTKDNGVIILIFLKERRIRLEVGYGLEHVLPDARAGAIIQNDFIPYFKTGDYERGILRGTGAVLRALEGESQPTPPPAKGHGREDTDLILAVLVLLGVFFLIDAFRYGHYRLSHRPNRDRYSTLEWWIRFSILLFILNLLARAGVRGMSRGSGGYLGSRGGFGGFSGGGGSFGGGGASGRW